MFIIKGEKVKNLIWSYGILDDENDEDTNTFVEKELNTAEFKKIYDNPLHQWFIARYNDLEYDQVEIKGRDVIVSRDEYQAYIDRISSAE